MCFLSGKVYFCNRFAIIAQLVEHRLPKPRVTGSSPAYRSKESFHILFGLITMRMADVGR